MSKTQDDPIVGLREPWEWVQPNGTAEIKKRLLEARDFNVHKCERENMCSVAHGEICSLESRLHDKLEENKQLRERLAATENHAERYMELLYAVQSKFQNESRHGTALRYIRERESSDGKSKAKAREEK